MMGVVRALGDPQKPCCARVRLRARGNPTPVDGSSGGDKDAEPTLTLTHRRRGHLAEFGLLKYP